MARAEGAPFDDVAPRLWVFPDDGGWGGRGAIRRLPDILGVLVGIDERKAAAGRLTGRRKRAAVALLRTALEATGQIARREPRCDVIRSHDEIPAGLNQIMCALASRIAPATAARSTGDAMSS